MTIELNRVLIAGRLTREPDIRLTTAGLSVANFGLAVNHRTKAQDASGQAVEEAHFFEVQTWDKRADFARNYLHKGSAVLIEGRLRQERWVDQQTQQARHKVVIVAERISFAESKAEAEARGGGGEYLTAPGARQGEAPEQAQAAPMDVEPMSAQQSSDQGQSTEEDLPF